MEDVKEQLLWFTQTLAAPKTEQKESEGGSDYI